MSLKIKNKHVDKDNEYLSNLKKMVKKKGKLVKKMPRGTQFVFERHDDIYKTSLGAIPIYNLFGKITHVYVVYEDFDGSIKYYDYIQ